MIVLNMIVKNEAHCIERCIKSVLPWIDAAVIVDTGSTDGTQELLGKLLTDKPHSVLEQQWVDFGFNRTQAFWSAMDAYPNGYAFVIDADEELSPRAGFSFPVMDRSGYAMWQAQGVRRFLQPRLLKLSDPWVYQGAMHEVAECLGGDGSRGIIEGCTITGHFDSARNKRGKQKYLDDAAIMEAMPETPRNVFYKAQCYRDAECYDRALELYGKRARMGDFEEEIYMSLVLIAQIYQAQSNRPSVVAAAYEAAYNYRPTRAEAPYYLAAYCKERGHHSADYWFTVAASIPMTTDQQGIDLQCYSIT